MCYCTLLYNKNKNHLVQMDHSIIFLVHEFMFLGGGLKTFYQRPSLDRGSTPSLGPPFRQVTSLSWSVPSAFPHMLHGDCSISYYSQPGIPSSLPVSPLLSNTLHLGAPSKVLLPTCGHCTGSKNIAWEEPLTDTPALLQDRPTELESTF